MVIELIVFALVSLIIWLIGKPLYAIVVLKIKFGKYVYVNFTPIKGFFHQQEESLRKHGDVMTDFRQIIQERPETKFIITNIFNIPLLLLIDPEYSKYLFTEHNNFTKFNYVGKQNIICEGIVYADGEWKRQKGILAEAFTYQKVKGRIPLIEQLTKQKLSQITDQKNVNMQEIMMQIAGEIVIKCFFGMDYNIIRLENGQELQEAICHFIAGMALMVKTNSFFQLKQFIFGELCWKYFVSDEQKSFQEQIQNIFFTINKIVEERIEKPLDNDDFLNIYVKEYLKDDSKITKAEINQQFCTLLLGGTDTSANQTCISLYHLALYPEIQDDLLNEIQDVLGEDTITADKLAKLEKMTSFIQEILRYKAVAQVITPRIPKHQLMINDLKIQSNWMVTPFICMTQYNPRNYDNPMEFNYKRFYRQNPVKSESSFVNVPFSGGGRTCIGLHMAMIEMKVFLSLILKKFRIKINQGVTPCWKHDLIYNIHPTNCYYLEDRI